MHLNPLGSAMNGLERLRGRDHVRWIPATGGSPQKGDCEGSSNLPQLRTAGSLPRFRQADPHWEPEVAVVVVLPLLAAGGRHPGP